MMLIGSKRNGGLKPLHPHPCQHHLLQDQQVVQLIQQGNHPEFLPDNPTTRMAARNEILSWPTDLVH